METQTQYQNRNLVTNYDYFFPKKNKSFKALIERTSLKSNISTSQVSRIIYNFLEEIEEEITKKGKCSVYGLGMLNLKKNKERVLNAPNNAGQIKPAFWSVGFKYDKSLYEKLNENAELKAQIGKKIKKKKK